MALCPVCAGDAAAISSFFPAFDIRVLAAALAHTSRSRYGDVIRYFPKTALIVCGDPSYPGDSSFGRCHTLLASTTAQRCAFCPNRFAHGADARY
jgi:hypothetical protein